MEFSTEVVEKVATLMVQEMDRLGVDAGGIREIETGLREWRDPGISISAPGGDPECLWAGGLQTALLYLPDLPSGARAARGAAGAQSWGGDGRAGGVTGAGRGRSGL